MSSAAMEVEWVCRRDGVPLVQNRTGRWFHIDAIPQDTPEHEAEAVSVDAYRGERSEFVSLRQAAQDMVTHHNALHPETGCAFASNLSEALRRS